MVDETFETCSMTARDKTLVAPIESLGIEESKCK